MQTKVVFGKQSINSVERFAVMQRSAFMMSQVQFRTFSSASTQKSIAKLSKALEKEIKYENENYTQLEDIETFLNESGFKFNEEQGVSMTLSKTVGDKLVEVQFEAR